MKFFSNHSSPYSPKLPLRKAWIYILTSVFLLCGPVGIVLGYSAYTRKNHSRDPKYQIIAVIQTCSNAEWLPTSYLAELLGLSIDNPTNLYQFNCKEAEKKILKCPLIQSARIRKIKPGSIYIEYTLRQAITYLGDYTNCAMDSDGVIIPYKPFFTPKNLPEIYLGLDDKIFHNPWGKTCPSNVLNLTLDILQLLNILFASQTTYVKTIDLTRAFAPSRGEREIVITLEERNLKSSQTARRRLLRLATCSYRQQLANYILLHPQLTDEPIVDLRISQLAFITPLH